jgi:hypothetical protein
VIRIHKRWYLVNSSISRTSKQHPHIKSTNVTPRPTIDTRPPLPAAQALVLTAAPPSDTTAEAEAEAEADDTLLAPPPEGDPVLVGLVVPVAVACGPPPPPVVLGALPLLLPPLLPL